MFALPNALGLDPRITKGSQAGQIIAFRLENPPNLKLFSLSPVGLALYYLCAVSWSCVFFLAHKDFCKAGISPRW